MTTEEQINANRENAQLGGVKTPEGKAISRLNAIKHGILANLLTEDENREATEIQNELIEEYQPQITIELILIERITIWYVRLRRAVKAESELLKMIYNPRITKSTPLFLDLLPAEEVVQEGYTPKIKATDIFTLENIYLRYESTIERNFYRALHELQELLSVRSGGKTVSPEALNIILDKYDKNSEE